MKISDYLHQVWYKLENCDLTPEHEDDLIGSLTEDEYAMYCKLLDETENLTEDEYAMYCKLLDETENQDENKSD